MQSAFTFIIDFFSEVFNILSTTKITAFGYSVSFLWLFLSVSFLGLVFTVLLPFVARTTSGSGTSSGKQSSERIKKDK